MRGKESVIVIARCELKIPSVISTVRPNSYPRDGIFNLHLTTSYYNRERVEIAENLVGYARIYFFESATRKFLLGMQKIQ